MKDVRVLHSNGTYLKANTGIGPMFGATREEAAVFKTELAALTATRHWLFASCWLEIDDGNTVEIVGA